LSKSTRDQVDDGMTNYNQKEMVLILRSIEKLLQENNRILSENNDLMKSLDDKLRSINFNTKG